MIVFENDSSLTIVKDFLKIKYIFWSENPRAENIQVSCFDKKKVKTTLIFLKKNKNNCHKTQIQ